MGCSPSTAAAGAFSSDQHKVAPDQHSSINYPETHKEPTNQAPTVDNSSARTTKQDKETTPTTTAPESTKVVPPIVEQELPTPTLIESTAATEMAGQSELLSGVQKDRYLRYLRSSDIPAILNDMAGLTSKTYNLDKWQRQWCYLPDEPVPGAAVLSYRWRDRAAGETVEDYLNWVEGAGKLGYSPRKLRQMLPGEWTGSNSPLNGSLLQIEAVMWLLWVHLEGQHEYLWIDQLCVPQDVDSPTKIGHIKESVSIYRSGTVYMLISPVVDYATGKIMDLATVDNLVSGMRPHLESWLKDIQRKGTPDWLRYTSANGLMQAARRGLFISTAYHRRVWTIQEATVADTLESFPLNGTGSVAAFQEKYGLVDWPVFNGWNSCSGEIRMGQKANPIAISYSEGDYTQLLAKIREGTREALPYLATASSSMKWVLIQREGLVNNLRSGSMAKRAHTVLSGEQVVDAACSVKADKVLATIPLVDYEGWKAATAGAKDIVQASVEFAYNLLVNNASADDVWGIRVYGDPNSKASGFPHFNPRRFYGDEQGVQPNGQFDASGKQLTLGDGSVIPVTDAFWVQHCLLQDDFWGGLNKGLFGQYNEGFRLSVEWGLEQWSCDPRYDTKRMVMLLLPPQVRRDHMHFAIAAPLVDDRGSARVIMVVDAIKQRMQDVVKHCNAASLGVCHDSLTLI